MSEMSKTTTNYNLLIGQVKSITMGESDLIANMANISAIIFNNIHDVNWAGFYLHKDKQLVLGPFQGNPACIRIPMGKGVCGTAAESKQAQLISDVHTFEGHIACDAASNSEIVIPIVRNGVLIGVLDIDSPTLSRFDNYDLTQLQKVVDILISTMD